MRSPNLARRVHPSPVAPQPARRKRERHRRRRGRPQKNPMNRTGFRVRSAIRRARSNRPHLDRDGRRASWAAQCHQQPSLSACLVTCRHFQAATPMHSLTATTTRRRSRAAQPPQQPDPRYPSRGSARRYRHLAQRLLLRHPARQAGLQRLNQPPAIARFWLPFRFSRRPILKPQSRAILGLR